MSKRIYVGNLPKKVTKNELLELFGEYGTVNEIELSSGSAVVVMGSGASEAIKALHQSQMGGRGIPITVGEVKPQR